MRTKSAVTLIALVAAACTGGGAPSTPPTSENLPATTLPAESVGDFMDGVTTDLLGFDPETMTSLGLEGADDRLTSLDVATAREMAGVASDALGRLDLYEVPSGRDEEISVELFRWWLNDIVESAEWADHRYAASFITGAHTATPEFLTDVHPLADAADVAAYLARLKAFPDQLRQEAERIEAAAAEGVLMPEATRNIAAQQVRATVTSGLGRLADRLDRVDAATGSDRRRASDLVSDQIRPAYEELSQVLASVATRSSTGAGELPDGPDYYDYALKHYITSEESAEELHQWGLGEVELVRVAMARLLSSMGYTGDLNIATLGAVAASPRLPLVGVDQRSRFIDINRQLAAAALEATSDAFGTVPERELIIQEPATGRGGGFAYYRAPDLSGERPGIYYLSMGDSVSAVDYKTTTVHEAIPGHHFQFSLQVEADNPLHQRAVFYSGFAEGWALYAERLAAESGLYANDQTGDLGRLRAELLRAVRVVVDTGIHALGWSYEEAYDYHMANSTYDSNTVGSEIARYIAWPGQAPAYLVGMHRILEARQRAAEALGDQFDLAGFHDEILRHGSLPMPVLDQVVDRWIEAQRLG